MINCSFSKREIRIARASAILERWQLVHGHLTLNQVGSGEGIVTIYLVSDTRPYLSFVFDRQSKSVVRCAWITLFQWAYIPQEEDNTLSYTAPEDCFNMQRKFCFSIWRSNRMTVKTFCVPNRLASRAKSLCSMYAVPYWHLWTQSEKKVLVITFIWIILRWCIYIISILTLQSYTQQHITLLYPLIKLTTCFDTIVSSSLNDVILNYN
jgi:hypothetical protein